MLLLLRTANLAGSATLDIGCGLTGLAGFVEAASTGTVLALSGSLLQASQSQPGPVDSQRIAEGFYRRKKRKKALETVETGEPKPVVVPEPVAPLVAPKPLDFRTLAELSGTSVEAFRAEVDREIADLLDTLQEDDDEEAFTMILTMLED